MPLKLHRKMYLYIFISKRRDTRRRKRWLHIGYYQSAEIKVNSSDTALCYPARVWSCRCTATGNFTCTENTMHRIKCTYCRLYARVLHNTYTIVSTYPVEVPGLGWLVCCFDRPFLPTNGPLLGNHVRGGF